MDAVNKSPYQLFNCNNQKKVSAVVTYNSLIPVDFTSSPWIPTVFSSIIDYTSFGSTLTSFTIANSGYAWKISGNFQLVSSNYVDGNISSIKSYNSLGQNIVSVTGLDITIGEYDSYALSNNLIGLGQRIYHGNDNINGSAYGDVMLGFDGNDTIKGAAQAFASIDSSDVLLGNNGSDVIYGYAGHDSIVGGSALVDAGDGNDSLYGGDGNDHIYGSGGLDTISGDAGSDLIVGGADNDTLSGGEGSDIFVYVLQSGYDLITDFSISDILTVERGGMNIDFNSLISSAQYDGQNTFLAIGDSGGITLAEIDASSLSDANFFFYG